MAQKRAPNRLLLTLDQEREKLAKKGAQESVFVPFDFVVGGIPRLPWKSPGLYSRRNGRYVLTITAGPAGMPYGQDRLLPIILATAYKALGCPEDRIIRTRSARDLLRLMGLGIGGKQLARLRRSIERMFGATFLLEDVSQKKRLSLRAYRLMQRVDLWFDQDVQANQHSLWPNIIKLDETFAEVIRDGGIPLAMEPVHKLKRNLLGLDLYNWQAWRSFKHLRDLKSGEVKRRNLDLPVCGEDGVAEQLGLTGDPAVALKQLRRAQKAVLKAWPECPNALSADGKYFQIRPCQAVPQGSRIALGDVVTRSTDLRAPPVPADFRPMDPRSIRLLAPDKGEPIETP